MKIKAILYDLDGTLVDLCTAHYASLNMALKEVSNIEIDYEDHIKSYNGLPTKNKLKKLTDLGKVEVQDHDLIFKKKQEYTLASIKQTLNVDTDKIRLHQYTKSLGIKLAVVSNSITETIYAALKVTGQLEYMDFLISNEVVNYPKPHGEGYIIAMVKLGFLPNECVIVEDSPTGIIAAETTGAHIWEVSGPHDVTWEGFLKFKEKYEL